MDPGEERMVVWCSVIFWAGVFALGGLYFFGWGGAALFTVLGGVLGFGLLLWPPYYGIVAFIVYGAFCVGISALAIWIIWKFAQFIWTNWRNWNYPG